MQTVLQKMIMDSDLIKEDKDYLVTWLLAERMQIVKAYEAGKHDVLLQSGGDGQDYYIANYILKEDD